jgi:CBS domain-containing protein
VPTPGPQGWGIVSDLDLVDAVHARAMSERTAGDTAARRTLSVGASDTLERAARLMHEFRESHLVVVDPASSAAVGVLSTLDVADALAEITTWEA